MKIGKVIFNMTVSLDGFVAGPNDEPENGLKEPIELEKIRVVEAPGVTHLGFSVMK